MREVARQHGLDYSLVRKWRDNYHQHGVMGLRKKYTHRSVAFKLEALETMWREGLSRHQTEVLFDIRECGVIGR
ncbi:helix-turn-helix domain-containing protein [Halomonas sp. 111]|uniref:helix-turn-helix domain-containing protein n=1 Tax=Halomonas sp. 111 TaxID=3457735 RepID=UPI00403364EC